MQIVHKPNGQNANLVQDLVHMNFAHEPIRDVFCLSCYVHLLLRTAQTILFTSMVRMQNKVPPRLGRDRGAGQVEAHRRGRHRAARTLGTPQGT